LGGIRRAVAARLTTLVDPEVLVFPFVTDSVSVPQIWIEPDSTNAKFQVQFGGAGTEFFLILTIVTNRVDEETAQDHLDGFIDEDGPLVAGLQEPGDDYLAVGVSYINALIAASYGTYKVGDADYFGVQISIIAVT
jgi:hypothetical protein